MLHATYVSTKKENKKGHSIPRSPLPPHHFRNREETHTPGSDHFTLSVNSFPAKDAGLKVELSKGRERLAVQTHCLHTWTTDSAQTQTRTQTFLSVCLGSCVNVCWSYCRSRYKSGVFQKIHENFLKARIRLSLRLEPLKCLKIT